MLGEFFLPFPPSVNRTRRYGRKGWYPTPEFVAFRQAAVEAVRAVWTAEPYLGTVSVELRLYGHRRGWDVDNRAKCCLDALEAGGAIANDNQVDRLLILRGPRHRGGGAWLLMEAMEPEPAPDWPHAPE